VIALIQIVLDCHQALVFADISTPHDAISPAHF